MAKPVWMVRSTRSLGLAALAVIAVAALGCASPAAQECGATGIFCPAGMHCAAAQRICLPDTNTCGNAHLDPGEACDDGNTNDGDGCSHDCLSDETCGNHIVDLARGEVCDDGNTRSGDGCSADCLSDETCGNKIVDTAVGEVCDDGNDIIGDGCSHNCRSLEVCGNGIRDPGEACDLIPQDLSKCSADCKSTLQCGNGEVDPNEECDVLGLDDDHADCRSDCVINRCGDGFVNQTLRAQVAGGPAVAVEQCDGGHADPGSPVIHPADTAACNIDCTTASCGDGKVNREFKPDGVHGEQCDNGAANSNTSACTARCQIAVCGDQLIEAGVEDCDDGPANSNASSCTVTCKAARCGDGLLQVGVEQCDDGNIGDGDGCSSLCVIERCGDGVANNHEACDTAGASQACNANCTTPSCGDGIVNPMFSHKHGQPGDPGPEQCDPPNPGLGCTADCRFERCGNGVVDSGEQCDNGSNARGSGCFECHREECGNGFLDQGEQCDDGNASDSDACLSSSTAPASCKIARCGDGKVETGVEQCDLGDAANGALGSGCSATCRFTACGNGVLDPGEQCDDGNHSDGDDCLSSDPAPTSCKIARCGDGKIDAAREQCDDGDAVNGTVINGCSASCQQMSCGNAVLDFGEDCDDGAADNGPGKRCNAGCKLNVCGDGDPLAGVEQCDDGVHNSDGTNTPRDTPACDSDCTFPLCGDHHVNPALHEDCDEGAGNSNTGTCTLACKAPTCGDGFVQAGEDCDDPTLATECGYHPTMTACLVCNNQCHSVPGAAHFCNDGHTDPPFEVCDDANPTCGSCSEDCKAQQLQAAVGYIFAAAGGALGAGTTNDRFTLSDGVQAKTFEFSNGATAPGNLKITFDPVTDSSASMAAKIAFEINTHSGLAIVASVNGGVVTLTNGRSSTIGNGSTASPRLTEQVTTPTFGIIEMSGGKGGDCANGQPSVGPDDCQSGQCTSGTCQ